MGLWHATLCSVFNGMHVIFIPYSLMKVNPASWMQMITKFKGQISPLLWSSYRRSLTALMEQVTVERTEMEWHVHVFMPYRLLQAHG